MILEFPDKHLADQEFYTLIKFFDLVIEKKGLDDEDDFPLSYFGLNSEENGTIFNTLGMSAQLLEITLDIRKGHNFEKQIEEAKEKAKESQKRNKMNY